MIKTEVYLSQEDKNSLLEMKKKAKVQLIFGFFVIPIFITTSLLFFWLDCSLSDAMIIFLFFGTVSGYLIYAFYKIYRLQESLDKVMTKNKKIILEAETASQFVENSEGNYQFFKNDETYYSFLKLKYVLYGNYIMKLTYFPENTLIKLEYAEPSGFVFNYVTKENQTTTKPYQTKISPLTEIDKKEMKAVFFGVLKVVNFVIFPIFLTVLGFASEWKFNEGGKLLVGIAISILTAGDIGLGIWYLVLKEQLQSPNKIVITGKVTGVVITSRRRSRALIFFGLDSFPVLGSKPSQVAFLGETVAIHYCQKANNEKGSLIRVEKL